ncbi:MAG: sulfotransferase [Candidatus Lokiarchaeota archaeon]|nr:sulfotransferase [Candidatus Lokiarchaeota archaeon]
MTLTEHEQMNYDVKHWKKLKSTPIAGYNLKTFFRVLADARFRVSFKYLPRFFWVLWTCFITLPMRVIENIKYFRKIKNTKIEKDPIFIIGYYRTGTTYLHLLFAKDRRLSYMSNLEGYAPLFYLSFEKLTRQLMEKSLPPTRPMDNVPLHLDEPIEEEYAVGAISKYSFYNALIFPRKFDYYSKYLSLDDCKPKDVEKWKKVYHQALQKVTFKNQGKQLVLKNPPNGFKIEHLIKMYPNAKFIFTYRDPYILWLSMYKFYLKTMEIFALQKWDYEKIKNGYVRNFNTMLKKIEDTKHLIPPENYVEIKYEDFVQNPIPFMKELYNKFDLVGYEDVEPEFITFYKKQQSNYIPNKWEIIDDVIRDVNEHWEEYRKKYGYPLREPCFS